MAGEEDKLKKVEELLKRIQKGYNKLGDTNPFRGMDPKKVSDSEQEISKLENALEGVDSKVRKINTTFGDLQNTLKSVVNEINPKALNANKLLEQGMKGLVTQARKLSDEEDGIGDLSKKQLKTILERTKASQKMAQDNAKSLLKERGLLDKNGNIKAAFGDKINKLGDEEKDKLITARGIYKDTGNFQQDLIDKIEDRIGLEDEFNKKLGFGGQLAKGLDKALQKAGLPALGIADAIDKTRKNFLEANREGGDAKKNFSILGDLAKNMGKSLKEAFSTANIVQASMVALVASLISADKATGELAKNLGISYQEALNLTAEASATAKSYGDILVTSKGIIEAQNKLNSEFGTSVKFSMDMAAEFASIQKRTNLSDKAMGFFARTSMQAGKSIKDTLKDVHTTVLEQNKQNKVSFSVKEIQEGIANASSRTQLIFKGNVKELSKAVIQAKMLGVSMESLNSIASSLLDFESSISSELEAELLIGKQLNLEKARQYALEGKMGKLAEEIQKQNIDAVSFGKMNRIQQEAIAKALGMNADSMADMLMNQQKLDIVRKKGFDSIASAQEKYNKLRADGLSAEEAALKVGDDSLANQLESASQAEKFEGVMNRVKEIFTSMAIPILSIFETMSSIVGGAENLAGILTGIAITYGVIKAAQAATLAFKAVDLAYQSTKAFIMGTQAVAATTTASAATLGIGTVAIIAGVAAVLGAIGAMAFMDDGVIGKDGGMVVSGPKGSIQLNKDDSVIAGTNLGGGGGSGQSMAMLKKELNTQNQLLKKLLDKDTNVYMDGNKVGTQLALSNPRMQ